MGATGPSVLTARLSEEREFIGALDGRTAPRATSAEPVMALAPFASSSQQEHKQNASESGRLPFP
jgi:hypothetical protein